jgi:hypothetical protein
MFAKITKSLQKPEKDKLPEGVERKTTGLSLVSTG